ncbi:MAG TPA: sugar transferase [Phycisphaerae bacterium]|nr:sugar transferase [Phycisphaerae bacterium]
MDVAAVLLLLPVILPVVVFIAVFIRVVSKGPILFKQERMGFRGAPFMCLKFRTMIVGADTSNHQSYLSDLMKSNVPMVKMDAKGDSRIIPFGLLLRSSGLDELPQLINVLRGEMSLVGPRPCLSYESQKYRPWQRERFDTLPGLTGLWQVSGKNKTTFTEMIQMDIDYVRNKTLWWDIIIILKTPLAIINQILDSSEPKPSQNPSPLATTAAAPAWRPMIQTQTRLTDSSAPNKIFNGAKTQNQK